MEINEGEQLAASEAEDAEEKSATPPVAAPTHLTLPDAIDLALVKSHQLRAATHAIAKAEALHGEAEWGWTPKISIESQFAPVPKFGANDADFDVFDQLGSWGIYTKHELSFAMPLFTFFKLSTAEELAQVGVDVEGLRKEEAALSVIFDVARAYYGLQLALALKTVSKDGNKILRDASRSLDKLLEAENPNVDSSDRYQLTVAEAEFERRDIQIKQAQRLAEDGLRVHTLVEGAITVPKMHFRPEKITLKSLEEVLEMGLSHRLDLAQLNKAIEAQSLKLSLEQWNWAPDFYLAGRIGYSYSNAVPEIPDDVPEFYVYDPYNSFGFGVLLGMKWKIDVSQRIYRIEREEHGLAQIKSQRELARRGATLDIEQVYFEAENALASVNVLRKSRRAAKQRMTQLYADYEIAGGDVDRLMRAIISYFGLRASYLQGLYDFRVALFKLRLKTGAESIDALISEGSLKDHPPQTDEDEDASEEKGEDTTK